jgi:formiminotetrahydrofolate cyclodeaminase
MELKRFLEKLSSDAPTPGGGSASALAGAISASLVAMVAGLSSKRSGPKLKGAVAVREKGLSVQKRLFRAIDEDSKSFDAVIEAYRLPKNSERERLHRVRQIQKAYRDATLVPRQVCQQSLRLLEYSRALVLKGNPKAISDAGVAAFLADAALAGGMLNIKINLVAVTEKAFIRRMNVLMRNWSRKRNQLMKVITMRLTGFAQG